MTAGQVDLRMPPDSGDDEIATALERRTPNKVRRDLELPPIKRVFEAHEMRLVPDIDFDLFVCCVCGWCEHIEVDEGWDTMMPEVSNRSKRITAERITAAYRKHLET